jgi:formate dehydrogenase gamma subunit
MAQKEIQRFPLPTRVEHILLAVSCIGLMITGLPIAFHELRIFAEILGGYAVTMVLHRILAIILIAECVYHCIYHVLKMAFVDRKHVGPALPGLQDVKDVIQNVLFALGLTDKMPSYGQYSWKEKLDYWGSVLFTPLLLVSGYFMMFPLWTMTIWPRQYLTGIRLFHRYDAIVVILAYFLHFYNSHMSSKEGMRWTMFRGKMSKEEAKEEHPRWVEQSEGIRNG